MQQLVIKNSKVIAIHQSHQDIVDFYPGCELVLSNSTAIIDGPDPRSEAEKLKSYINERRVSYPPIIDQLDMMYHDEKEGTTTWVDAIRAVKDKYPSGEE